MHGFGGCRCDRVDPELSGDFVTSTAPAPWAAFLRLLAKCLFRNCNECKLEIVRRETQYCALQQSPAGSYENPSSSVVGKLTSVNRRATLFHAGD
jgi:hypothetical protein